jgi:hypothetical protein
MAKGGVPVGGRVLAELVAGGGRLAEVEAMACSWWWR